MHSHIYPLSLRPFCPNARTRFSQNSTNIKCICCVTDGQGMFLYIDREHHEVHSEIRLQVCFCYRQLLHYVYTRMSIYLIPQGGVEMSIDSSHMDTKLTYCCISKNIKWKMQLYGLAINNITILQYLIPHLL